MHRRWWSPETQPGGNRDECRASSLLSKTPLSFLGVGGVVTGVLVPVTERIVVTCPFAWPDQFLVGEQCAPQSVGDAVRLGAAHQHGHRHVAVSHAVVPIRGGQ